MKYGGYNVEENDGGIAVYPVKDFSLKQIFECGQCFRWRKWERGESYFDGGCDQKDVAQKGAGQKGTSQKKVAQKGVGKMEVAQKGAGLKGVGQGVSGSIDAYSGVAMNRAVTVYMEEPGVLNLIGADYDDFVNIWYGYFDLGTDYSEIKNELSKNETMRKAIDFGSGIRILKQDFFETLISFILSANNRIPMIMKTVEKYSEAYGTRALCMSERSGGADRVGGTSGAYKFGGASGAYKFGGASGANEYSFPDAKALACLTSEELRLNGGGFRCKYVIASADMYCGEPKIEQKLKGCSVDGARAMLKRFPGVGDKVADCTLLFSGLRTDVFPVDVWVKRVMEKLFFGRNASVNEIMGFAEGTFGKWAGIAQQYLFYYARETGLDWKG